MKLDFSSASRIIFGIGAVDQLGDLVHGWGERAIIVHGGGSAPVGKVKSLLEDAGVECVSFAVEHEPAISTIDDGLSLARQAKARFVVSVGGGSTIDTGKTISALMTNPGRLLDYLEVVGSGQHLVLPPLPFIAIPTTAGTGSEATKNAVIGVPDRNVKVSLRSNHLLPRIALVDPQLTVGMPRKITAYSGMDAITQLVEPFVSIKSNWMIDALCREGLERAASALKSVFNDPNDMNGREMMSYASLLSGIALANAGLGAVHGFAGPIGGMFDAPHGAICARLLPEVVRVNIRSLQRWQTSTEILDKYATISRIITGEQNASLDDGIIWLNLLIEDLKIPRLAEFGITRHQCGAIIERSSAASSMKGNPVVLSRDELLEILERSL